MVEPPVVEDPFAGGAELRDLGVTLPKGTNGLSQSAVAKRTLVVGLQVALDFREPLLRHFTCPVQCGVQPGKRMSLGLDARGFASARFLSASHSSRLSSH